MTDSRPVVERGPFRLDRSVVFAENDRWLLGWEDSAPVLWRLDPKGSAERMTSAEPMAPAEDGVFSPDSRSLALAGSSRVSLWDLNVPRFEKPTAILNAQVYDGLRFSANSSRLLARTTPGSTLVWNVADANSRPVTVGHRFDADFALSPDGRWFVVSDYPSLIVDLDANGATYTVPSRFNDAHPAAQPFSRDSRWFLASDREGSTLCDLSIPPTEKMLVCQKLGPGPVAGFGPDARYIYGHGHSVALWLLDPADLIGVATRTVSRDLTADEWKDFFKGQPYHETRRLTWRHAPARGSAAPKGNLDRD